MARVDTGDVEHSSGAPLAGVQPPDKDLQVLRVKHESRRVKQLMVFGNSLAGERYCQG